MSRGWVAVALAGAWGCVGPGAGSSVDGGAFDAVVRGDGAGARSDGERAGDAEPGAVSRIDAMLALLEGGADVAAIDALAHEIAWNEGWPLHEGTRWLFVTHWDDAPAFVSLVGDLNGWSPSVHPANRSGVHFWVLLEDAELSRPAQGAKYKWFGAPDVWRAPPEATAYGFDAFGEHGWVRPPGDAPHFERFPALASMHLETPRTVRARIPAGFVPHSPMAARARTLLVHDGQNVFGPEGPFGGWQVDVALDAGGYDDVVAIAIDSVADRIDAYTHVSDRIGGEFVGGRADDYLDLVEHEVLPFARRRWGLVARGRSVMIAGSSLGGLVSLYAAMTRPELWGCAAGLSSALWWGSAQPGATGRTLMDRWRGHPPLGLYLDSGGGVRGACVDADGDGVRDDADDADAYCETIQMRDVLVASGFREGVDLHHRHEPGATHDEAAWRARFPFALTACSTSGWTNP